MPRSTRRLVVAVVVLSSPAPVLLPASAASARPVATCAARVAAAAKKTDAGGRFERVARSSSIEVYAPDGPGFGAYHYVCRRSTGTLHRFARNSGGAAASDVVTTSFAARGNVFAYRTSVRGDTSSERFVARDGRTGRVLRDTGAVRSTEQGDPRSDQLVLLPGAAIAWATKDAGVHVTDAHGDHVVGAPTGRQPTRLRATATTLRWTEGGRRLHARLP
jgi:hypothetical protein